VIYTADGKIEKKNARKVRLVIENGEVFSLDDLLKRVPNGSR